MSNAAIAAYKAAIEAGEMTAATILEVAKAGNEAALTQATVHRQLVDGGQKLMDAVYTELAAAKARSAS